MDISIVIPAFNEQNKINFDVEAAAVFIRNRNWQGEVIVVDDGSRDHTREEVRKVYSPPGVNIHVLRHPRNRGKGAAVRTGILASKGHVVLYADSGTCVPYPDALPSIERIRSGELDLALASRRHKKTVIHRDRPLKRRFLSQVFRWTTRLITGLPRSISDSQCGFKVYGGSMARSLFELMETDGFLFEIEILLLALHRGLRLEEFPIHWTCDPDTRLQPGRIAAGVLKGLFRLRSRMKRNKIFSQGSATINKTG
ncbi:MAG: glycosyltransferase [Candidatus Aminicenantes bacterium]|nr:glycosyltransferase [Candidatus Aminicenantes bacterium]